MYGDPQKGEIGIDRLIAEEVILSAFPLHDGEVFFKQQDKSDAGTNISNLHASSLDRNQNSRAILNRIWSSYAMWYKYQPIDLVKNYFGEKIAFYFAWLGAYTSFLLAPAIVGFIVFIINVITRNGDSSV